MICICYFKFLRPGGSTRMEALWPSFLLYFSQHLAVSDSIIFLLITDFVYSVKKQDSKPKLESYMLSPTSPNGDWIDYSCHCPKNGILKQSAII